VELNAVYEDNLFRAPLKKYMFGIGYISLESLAAAGMNLKKIKYSRFSLGAATLRLREISGNREYSWQYKLKKPVTLRRTGKTNSEVRGGQGRDFCVDILISHSNRWRRIPPSRTLY
jgi:hypothetical protein